MTDRLKQLAASLIEKQEPFKVGDAITWKDGMRNKKSPADGRVAVVTEVFEKPIFDPTQEAGSPYFREPLSIKAAILDSDDDLREVHLDSRRFRLA